jgi:hypothetical protein
MSLPGTMRKIAQVEGAAGLYKGLEVGLYKLNSVYQ